ncbi:T9SS type A sorting domain-containing protein [Epilithonimonas zeae]|uniref:Por secretion system C-terminal sorting domain-containing protein n=1 Tax=Epilithonimonas zeae TaxID=1416779 RepID=A0A1N6J2A4_9FLAO|nr:T9SS type A sorting domain-containing protein [Epilithonimonas zeae]SIO38391.1 Por secretion system C-terminal sorting domain-containing protein [Epilithonimonas zeae]
MKKLYFIFSFILGLSVFSQNNNSFEIVKGFHANTYGGGMIFQTIFDSNLDHITVGQANGPYKFMNETINSTGISSLYISKNSKVDGSKIWIKTLDPGPMGELVPNAVTMDSQDNIYIIAAFEGAITLNNVNNSADNKDFDQVLLKFDSSGNLLWIKELPKKAGSFPLTISMRIDGNNLYALINAETIVKFNIFTGDKIAEKKFDKLYITQFEAKANQLYLNCQAHDPVSILDYNFEDFSSFILKTDSNLVETNYLRIFNNNNYGNLSGFNVLISEDNYLYVSFAGYSTFQIIAQSNNGLFAMPIAQNSLQIGSALMILGKFSMDFTNYKWFYKYPSSGGASLLMNKGRNYNINLTSYFPNFSIGIDNQILYFNARGLINISSEGHLSSFYHIPNGYNSGGSSKSINVAYTDTEDYIAIPSDYHASLTFKGNASDSNPLLIKKYSDENLGGTISNGNLLKTFENGNTYQNVNHSKSVPVFYGTSMFSVSETNRSISKISPSGSIIWNIQSHEYEDFPSESYGNDTGINNSEEISYIVKCRNEIINQCQVTASNGEKFYGNAGDFLVSKINSDGHFLFKNKFVPLNSSSTMENRGIFATEFGETLLVGLVSGDFQYLGSNYSFPTKSMMVCKLSTSGNISFLRSFPYTYDNILIQQDQANNIYLFFNTTHSGSLTYDSITISDNNVNSKAIFLKMNASGQVISGKDFNSGRSGYQPFYINSICKLSTGFAIYGNTQGNTTADNIQFTNPYISSNTFIHTTDIITRLDTIGNILWSYPLYSPETAQTSYGYQAKYMIAKDQEDNLYITPTFKRKLTYRNSEILLNEDYKQSILLKLDGSGNLLSQKPLGLFLSSPIVDVYGINKISILAQVVAKPLDNFDYGYIGGYNAVTIFLEKEELATQDFPKDIFSIYPNPTSDILNITTKEKINNIEIYDSIGRKVTAEFNSNNQIDVQKLISGVYYIRITTDKNNLTSKFIKK